MKKILMILLAMVILSGCARTSTLTKVQSRYGSPARVEIECIAGGVCDENTYYNNKDAVKYIYWFYYWNASPLNQPRNIQECWELKADKDGKVITKREYIEQKSRMQLGRTPIQVKGGRLPGAE